LFLLIVTRQPMDTGPAFKLAELRGQIAELGSSIRQLRKARTGWRFGSVAHRSQAGRAGTPHELKWYDRNAANPPWIKALADVRRVARRGGNVILPPSCERRIGAGSARFRSG
jgi:hypothetical protein